MSTTDEILAAVDALPLDEKLIIASRIWASLPLEDQSLPDDADLAILDQRMAEIDAGTATTVSIDEVRRRMHERLKRYG